MLFLALPWRLHRLPTVRYSFLGQGAKKTARLSSIIYSLFPCARATGVYFHNCGRPYVLFPPVLRNKAPFHRICRSLLPRSSHAGFPVLSRTDALQTCLPVPSRPGALIPVPLLCVCGGRMFHVKHPTACPVHSGELSLAEQVAFRGNVSRETFRRPLVKFSCKFPFFCGQCLESPRESCYNSTRAKAADFGRSAHQQSVQAAPSVRFCPLFRESGCCIGKNDRSGKSKGRRGENHLLRQSVRRHQRERTQSAPVRF